MCFNWLLGQRSKELKAKLQKKQMTLRTKKGAVSGVGGAMFSLDPENISSERALTY